MEIRVLLFVQEGGAKQKYIDALSDCGVQVFVAPSFLDLSKEICSQTYHGLFLDMPTKMKALKENKAYVYHLVEKFPVSHLQLDNTSGEIRCFHFNRKAGSTLLDFIDNQCRTFTPRMIRADSRIEINLPVLVSKKIGDKRPERAVTKNISRGGCFIFSTRRWNQGGDLWLRFKDLPDIPPIHARIRTVVKWGESRQIPGIGVKFEDLSEFQTAELARLNRLEDQSPSFNESHTLEMP